MDEICVNVAACIIICIFFSLFKKNFILVKTTPQSLLARLLVIIGRPHEDRDRGLHALKFMKAVVPAIHKGPVSVWDKDIPILIQYLECK